MTRIEISEEDGVVLRRILESTLSDLRMEIADTDRQDFRDGLKADKAVLQRVLDQLEPG
jgi:uncharacterized protein YlxP (DUF503 family)